MQEVSCSDLFFEGQLLGLELASVRISIVSPSFWDDPLRA
jgi:hypothetical protein